MHNSHQAQKTVDQSVEAWLLTAEESAALCGMSRSNWFKQSSAGAVPKPIKIGALSRWRRSELFAWIEAGCPPRSKWHFVEGTGKAGKS